MTKDRLVTWAARVAALGRQPTTGGDIKERVGVAEHDVAGSHQASGELSKLHREVELRTRELSDALMQQTATASIFKAISRLTFNLQTVLNTLVESAAKLSNSGHAAIYLRDGMMLRGSAFFGARSEEVNASFDQLLPVDRKTISGRVMMSGQPEFIPDIQADPDYDYSPLQEWSETRSLMAVPLLRQGNVEGVFSVGRPEPRAFTARQSELIQTFADQAMIAIENARLFDEAQQRNRELVATSEVLRVISRSPTDVQPVFDAIAQSAARLCNADYSFVYRFDGSHLHFVAHHGLAPDVAEAVRREFPMKPGPGSAGSRAVLSGAVEHIPEIATDPDYVFGIHAKTLNTGSVVAVPMIRDGTTIGAIALDRTKTGYFPERQVELLKTFADQAVIAIENVRLFREVEARTEDLSEALQQQTATADVLKTISRSTFDLDTVLAALVASAAQLCGANYGGIYLSDGEKLLGRAAIGHHPEDFKELITIPVAIDRKSVAGRVALSGRTEHIPDVFDDPDWDRARFGKYDNFRSIMGVPLLKAGRVEGVFFLGKPEPGDFTARQGELVQTFADQAVIAVENVRLFDEVQRRNRELTEALEQQTATSAILRAIAASPTDIQPVLDAVAESAARLCDAFDSIIFLKEDTTLAAKAHHGAIPLDFASRPIARDWVTGRAFVDRTPVHVNDLLQVASEFPASAADAERQGHRTILAVPLMRDDEAIGALVIRRLAVRAFNQNQIDLLTTFANQAVIAIENVRLFEQVQARTRELQESLDYQTATSDVLNVISRSPSELQPVLDVIIETAVRLCEADGGTIARERDGQFFRSGQVGFSAEFGELMLRSPVELSRATATGRTLVEGKVVHIHDADTDPEYVWPEAQKLGRLRTMLGVPLMRNKAAIGAIALVRSTVRPFTKKQIELVTTFADQAVIAIENARLFEEVKARNRELTEALEQQTATSAILRAIAGSPTDIQPVLRTVTESAAKLCEAHDAAILLKEENSLAWRAHHGPIPIDFEKWPIGRDWVTGRAFVDRKPVHVRDLLDAADEYPAGHAMAARLGHRTILAVPLMREREGIGALVIRRVEVRPFNQKQIDLLTTFADQAVIAIENVRLFEEVQARTAQLARSVGEMKALGEVSQAVNSTINLKTVLETIVAKAVQLSDTDAGAIYVYSKSADRFRLRATYGMSADLIAAITNQAIGFSDAGMGEAARLRQPVQVPDLAENAPSAVQKIVLEAGFRGVLIVPLLRPNRIVGALVVRRRTPGRFSDSTVRLLETFAAQSVLAIQNARLFSEIEEKSRQLEIASRHKSQFLANMSHELRTPLNSVLGFTEMMVDGLYGELPERAKATLGRVQANGRHLLGLINDVLDLSKIEAGQLTLSIDDYAMGQIVKTVAASTEPLARAKGLNLSAIVAEGLPLGRGDERRLSQVLLNLVGNAVKFTDQGQIEIAAQAVDGYFEVLVRDTGPGIAPEHQKRIFEEFQQVDESSTRQKGGTGLGLAISKRIVEMHGGTIHVDSAVGAGSTFRVAIPIRAEKG